MEFSFLTMGATASIKTTPSKNNFSKKYLISQNSSNHLNSLYSSNNTSTIQQTACKLLNPFSKNSESNFNEIVILLMPTYYISKNVTTRDTKICQSSWNLILGNKSLEFQLKTEKEIEFHLKYHGKCLNWFTNIFFDRFFDVNPISRSLFANKDMEYLKAQIIKVISLTLSQTRDSKKFIKLMKRIGMLHNQLGVQAIEYGIMGTVLFYSLEKCLGRDGYTISIDTSWKTIYSSMLRYIVPECVKYHLEQRKKDEQYENYCRIHSSDYKLFGKVSSSSINSRENSIRECLENQSQSNLTTTSAMIGAALTKNPVEFIENNVTTQQLQQEKQQQEQELQNQLQQQEELEEEQQKQNDNDFFSSQNNRIFK